MKTCEEYVLKELEDTKNELQLVKKELEELKNKEVEVVEVEEVNTDVFNVNERAGYYYYINIISIYDFNRVLKENGKTPDFLKDENNIEEFMNLKANINSVSYVVAEVRLYYYDFLITFNGKTAIIIHYNDGSMSLINVDEYHYLSKEEAKKNLRIRIKQKIDEYFKYNYDEKFEEIEK